MARDRTRRRAVVLGLLLTALIIAFYAGGNVGSRLRSVAGAVVEPFSLVVRGIGQPIGHFLAGAVNYSDIVSQNHVLRNELGAAQLRANESAALTRQLAQITAALKVPYVGSLTTLVAQVTTNSPSNFSATFDISKGRSEGVLAGMPVVGNGGLIGRVLSTTQNGATVLMITDATSTVGATFSASAPDVIVNGRGVNSALSVSSVPLTVNVSPGVILSTDGLQGGLYPPGLPVARITKVTLSPGESTYDLALKPVANLKNLSYVDVVLWEPST